MQDTRVWHRLYMGLIPFDLPTCLNNYPFFFPVISPPWLFRIIINSSLWGADEVFGIDEGMREYCSSVCSWGGPMAPFGALTPGIQQQWTGYPRFDEFVISCTVGRFIVRNLTTDKIASTSVLSNDNPHKSLSYIDILWTGKSNKGLWHHLLTLELDFQDLPNDPPHSFNVQAVRRLAWTCPQLHWWSHCKVSWWGRGGTDLGVDVSSRRILASKSDLFCFKGRVPREQTDKMPPLHSAQIKSDSFAYRTIHIFSSERSTVFENGGKVWKEGGHRLDVEGYCELLWCILSCCITRLLMSAYRSPTFAPIESF